MPTILGQNQYGKAENRVVKITRDGDTHHIKDLNVSVALSGDMDDVHYSGSNANVLPTDTTKNTVFAFAKEYGIESAEQFGIHLARHFVSSQEPIHRARIRIEEYAWERIATSDGNSKFIGADEVKDKYTTLKEAYDRILATDVSARWRYNWTSDEQRMPNWEKSYEQARKHMLQAFAETYSLSLQQTLYQMGSRIINSRSEIDEIRFSLPNNHHFLVDLEPFGLENDTADGAVYFAADRPYGLIEATVLRDGVEPKIPVDMTNL